MERSPEGKKIVLLPDGQQLPLDHALPPQWTTDYGNHRQDVSSPLQGLICGTLQNKEKDEIEAIALDCDDANSWALFTSLDPTYQYRSASKGKPGGTIIYRLPDSLRHLKQYSIKNEAMAFEYMAQRESGPNAMVFLPTEANHTKTPIPDTAVLTTPPPQVEALLISLKPKPPVEITTTTTTATQLYNAPLIKKYVGEIYEANTYKKLPTATPVAKKLYKIITPKKFRHDEYKTLGYLDPNSPAILQYGSWSEYIVGVSAIAGADPSVGAELYVQFMQAIVAQTDDPMPSKRLLAEVINPMVRGKSSISGKSIWKYDERWDQQSLQIINQYGEPLEYYILEDRANTFIEYNTVTAATVPIQGTRSIRDHIYSRDSDPAHSMPSAELVKRLKLIQIRDNIKLPVGISTDHNSHALLNSAKAEFPLQVLRDPNSYDIPVSEDTLEVKAFNLFIAHLLNGDKTAITFFKQVISYHGRHLVPCPVIIYMVGQGGAGKSVLATLLELIFGVKATRRPNAKQCASQYNDFLENTALLILTETSDSSRAEQAALKSVLKTVTGESYIDVETKGKPLRSGIELFALPLLLANDPWYTEDTEDRRLFSIMPRTGMTESLPISKFENLHGIRLVDTITKGIKTGVISKYLSQFCPKQLPEVPLTQDKKLLSAEQKNPIMIVKNLVANSDWFRLFDMFQQHNVSTFFTAMEAAWLRDKDSLFKQQLVDLVLGIRGDQAFPSDAEISRAFTVRFLPRVSAQYRPVKQAAKKLGYVKWHVPIGEAYNEWKIQGLSDD